MELTFILALAAGALAGPPLLMRGRKLDAAAMARIERRCARLFPLFLTLALGLLVAAFRGRDLEFLALLLLVPGGALAVLAAALLPHPWRWRRHIIAAALVIGALNVQPFLLLGNEEDTARPRADRVLLDDTEIHPDVWVLRGRTSPGR